MKRFLAVAAALFLLLRPLCDVQAAGGAHGEHLAGAYSTVQQEGGDTAACCGDLADGSLVKASDPAAARGAEDGKLVLATSASITVHPAAVPAADVSHPRSALFTRSSFYARSARIRR